MTKSLCILIGSLIHTTLQGSDWSKITILIQEKSLDATASNPMEESYTAVTEAFIHTHFVTLQVPYILICTGTPRYLQFYIPWKPPASSFVFCSTKA